MATAARTISPLAGARKVIAKIKGHLPGDARWNVEYFEEDGVYLLNVYAEGLDRMEIHRAAGHLLSDLSQRGLPMAIIMGDTRPLKWHPELETFPV